MNKISRLLKVIWVDTCYFPCPRANPKGKGVSLHVCPDNVFQLALIIISVHQSCVVWPDIRHNNREIIGKSIFVVKSFSP